MTNITKYITLIITSLCAISVIAGNETDITELLAIQLDEEGSYEAAAIEYRRLAMTKNKNLHQAGYYWAAAYEYYQANKPKMSAKMLDRSEEFSLHLKSESLLLRAELSKKRPDVSEFYFSSLASSTTSSNVQSLASRRLANIELARGNISAARKQLSNSSIDSKQELNALNAYVKGHDKRPGLGGLLGMIPGLGYMYSGEYANGFRSLILNGIFIFAMVDTADDKEWGAFAAVTFFELTWYTGSIYGGVDAAHRYNRNRLDNCMDAISGESTFAPDLKQIPLVKLHFTF